MTVDLESIMTPAMGLRLKLLLEMSGKPTYQAFDDRLRLESPPSPFSERKFAPSTTVIDMLLTKKNVILLLALGIGAALIIGLALSRLYYIQSLAGANLFWNDDEADVFVSYNQHGFAIRYIAYPTVWALAHLPFGGPRPVAAHSSALVINITSKGVRRYAVDNFWLSRVEPFNGALYGANLLPTGKLMKWSGTGFVPLTADEAKAYYAHAGELPVAPAYENVQGWSEQAVAGLISNHLPITYKEPGRILTAEIGGQKMTFVMNSGFFTRNAYVILKRAGEPPQTIWHLDEHFHRVSRAEYRKTFERN